MFRKLLLFVTGVSLIATPAHAQLVVFDPGNLVQTTLIAYRMQQHYAELRAQYLTILRMGQGLGNLDRYRSPRFQSPATTRVAGTSAGRGFRP